MKLDRVYRPWRGSRWDSSLFRLRCSIVRALRIKEHSAVHQQHSDVNKSFSMHGAAGRKFFTEENGVPISGGAVVYRGFKQSFRWTSSGYPLCQLSKSNSSCVCFLLWYGPAF